MDDGPTILFVKVAEEHEVRVNAAGAPRRVVDDRDLWLLPGATCFSNDVTIFQQVYNHVFIHLYVICLSFQHASQRLSRLTADGRGISISRFKQLIHSEIMTIDDRQAGEKRVLVLTFTARWREVSPMALANQRWETALWVPEDTLRDHAFSLSSRELRHVLKSYIRGSLMLSWRHWRI